MKGACIVGDQRERKCGFVCLCEWVHMCMCIYICHIKMEVCVFIWVCICVCECVNIYVTYEWKCMCVCVCTPSQAHFYPCHMECWPSRVNTMRSRASRTEPPGRWWDSWPPVPPVLRMTENIVGILSLVRRVFCFCDKSFYQVLWKPKVFMFKA